MDNTMNTIKAFRKGKTLRVFLGDDVILPGPTFDDKTYESVNLAKKASRKLGLGKVRNVDTLPYAPQVVV